MLSDAALLEESEEYFICRSKGTVRSHFLGLSSTVFVHAVTGLCSRALTAKELPKAFQVNADRADSRILLTSAAATAIAKFQIQEQGRGVDPRCPLTGKPPCRVPLELSSTICAIDPY